MRRPFDLRQRPRPRLQYTAVWRPRVALLPAHVRHAVLLHLVHHARPEYECRHARYEVRDVLHAVHDALHVQQHAAGLNLYYFCSLSITMLQMVLIRKFTNEKKVRARMAAYDAKHKNGGPQKKSKFQQRMEEMQRMTEEMQKKQNKR